MIISVKCLIVVLVMTLTVCAFAEPPQKDGSLDDLRALDADANIAADAFDLPISMDASDLAETNQYSEYSRKIELNPDTRYTLGITYRATGPSLITAGVKWVIDGEPTGLVDDESIRAAWPQTDNFRLRVLTFRSDHKHTTARIILKASGGMSLEVKEVRLVEGWYCD